MTTITALPTPPARSQDPTTFITNADAFMAALPTFGSQLNTVAGEVDSNAVISAAAQSSATASAAAAAASAGVTIWVSGTTYAIGDCRFSPITYQSYRRKTAGAGTTDPSLDGTNWVLVVQNGQSFSGIATSAGTASMTTAHLGQLYMVTATGATITFPPVASCAVGSVLTLAAEYSAGTTTLKGNGAELITNSYGATANTTPINAGETVQYVSNGASWNQFSYDAVTCTTQATSDNSTKLINSLWAKVGFSVSLSTIGYVVFPTWLGGLIIQYGSGSASTGGTANSYTLAFPSSVYGVSLLPLTTTGVGISFQSGGLTGFTAHSSTGTPGITWFAIGK